MTNVKIGCDPELFVKKNGEFVSGWGMIPGDKANPHKVKDGAVQVDGMALEFNTDPASSQEEFCANVASVMSQLQGMVPKGYELVNTQTANFSEKILSGQPEEALEFGCDPDYNAYTGLENTPPNPEGVTFRTGAGHVHIGWTEGADVNDPEHIDACQMLVKQLDYYLGLPSLLWDGDNKRRELYGKAGAYRVKPYGVEYRTLSNAWLSSPELISWVYGATVKAFEHLVEGDETFSVHGEMAQTVINRGTLSDNTKKVIERLCGLLEIGVPPHV